MIVRIDDVTVDHIRERPLVMIKVYFISATGYHGPVFGIYILSRISQIHQLDRDYHRLLGPKLNREDFEFPHPKSKIMLDAMTQGTQETKI